MTLIANNPVRDAAGDVPGEPFMNRSRKILQHMGLSPRCELVKISPAESRERIGPKKQTLGSMLERDW